MGRRPTAFTCGQEDRAELERLSRSRTEPMQRVQRAQIILACLGGEPQAQIAARLEKTGYSEWAEADEPAVLKSEEAS